MFARKLIGGVTVLVLVGGLAAGRCRAEDPKPLSEADVIKRLQLLTDDELVAEVTKRGIDFSADDAALARLKSAGASEAFLEAVRKAGEARAAASKGRTLTYDNLLDLLNAGVGEEIILKRLEQSPTVFTLGEAQVEGLKKAGASARLLEALQNRRPSAAGLGDVTDLVVILDCSGSMNDQVKVGLSKMDVAQGVVTDLIGSFPEGRRLCLIVYGHNLEQKCEAVEVLQKLAPVTAEIKHDLKRSVNRLRALGHTPIARALQLAGKELAGAQGNSGLILITDGMETCHGDPNKEAAKLAQNPNLTFGLHVIGFNVEPAERTAVEGIAQAGNGKFYDAQSADKLKEAVGGLKKTIVASKPVPQEEKVVKEPPPRPRPAPPRDENTPEIKALVESLQDKDGDVRREAADGLRKAGVHSALVIDALKKRIADDVWIPKPRFVSKSPYDPKGGGKQAALDALRELAPNDVTDALRLAMKSRNANVRAWAAQELSNPSSPAEDSGSSSSASTPGKDKASSAGQGTAMPGALRGFVPGQPQKGGRFKGYGKSQSFGGAQSKTPRDSGKDEGDDVITSARSWHNVYAFVYLRSGDGKTRREGAEGLHSLDKIDEDAISALVKRVADDVWIDKGTGHTGDPEEGGKAAALEALRKHAPKKATEALRQAEKSKNPGVRAWAMKELKDQ